MTGWKLFQVLVLLGLMVIARVGSGSEPLRVIADFEGGSVAGVEIDQQTRTIRCMPGGDPRRGWPCWWWFRVEGTEPGETIRVRLRASNATVDEPGSPLRKPLAASWAMPHQATLSHDGVMWKHTEKGVKENDEIVYSVCPETTTVHLAWGPPYTPTMAHENVALSAKKVAGATADPLCRSAGGRPVPMLHIQSGELPRDKRRGIWIQARQHAWESGSSWVAQGLMEWLVSDDERAGWLRENAEIFMVPIMDIDNTTTGNGGKDAQPHDHNRDWSAEPHWKETIAAQAVVKRLVAENRMDLFLDLHNPAPGDPTFFYALTPDLLGETMLKNQQRFIELAYGRISRAKPMIPMSNRPKYTGASYHPRWREISANWVSMNGNPHTAALCLETIWNGPSGTVEGYRTVGQSLGPAIHEYLAPTPQ